MSRFYVLCVEFSVCIFFRFLTMRNYLLSDRIFLVLQYIIFCFGKMLLNFVALPISDIRDHLWNHSLFKYAIIVVFFLNIDPTAEVIALSPTTLMATNRFVCEICNKGFQRDQNLQLHRRGHNLPWKLKQRTTTEVRKRVYICPETSCVHHNPARALGDLTGIKKHFSRKHGEKKWKCDKCSKRYAVQSDWKAHQKTCGTREYKCDCGTIFSRYIL